MSVAFLRRVAASPRFSTALVRVANTAALVAEAQELLDQIEAEVRRLALEAFTFRNTGRVAGVLILGPLGPFIFDDPTGLEARARTYEGLIEQLERFVTDVFNRVEAKALAGDAEAALRLRDSTARILGAAVTSSVAEDLSEDVRVTVKEAIADLKVAGGGLVLVAGAALALSAINFVRGR
jgi:hypothetical protein